MCNRNSAEYFRSEIFPKGEEGEEEEQISSRVNILAKSSNFSLSWNQNMPISSLFFYASTNENLHNIFQMAQSAENFPFFT